MKLMTYNILNGGEERLPLITKVIKEESPDYLTINEANTFAAHNNEILKKVAKETGFPYYNIALSGEFDFHVAAFSKYPFKFVQKLQPLMRACLITKIDTDFGEISIASLHLTPNSEDSRHPEIDLVINNQVSYPNRILMGDMNSLSEKDDYNSDFITYLNEKALKRFTTNGKLRFDAIEKIKSCGYFDSAVHLNKNKEYTSPTLLNQYSQHYNMRLDYIFVSKQLLPNLSRYRVIKDEITKKASDHYPVTLTLK